MEKSENRIDRFPALLAEHTVYSNLKVKDFGNNPRVVFMASKHVVWTDSDGNVIKCNESGQALFI